MRPLPSARLFARALACAFALLAPAALHADILANGDMSAGADKVASWNQMWVGTGKLGAFRDEAVFRSAPSSLRLTAREGSAKGQIAQSVPTVPGERLAASGWIKCEGADTTAQIALQFFNANHAPVGFTQIRYVAGDTGWTEGKVTAVAPASAARVAFVLLIEGDGQAWLDDAVLTRSKEPTLATPPPAVTHSASAPIETDLKALAGEGTLIAAIADFRRQNFAYGYEGWKHLAAVTSRDPQGLLLTGPAAGGGGIVYASPAPIDGATHIRLRYFLNEGNSARSLNIKLIGSPEATISASLNGENSGRLVSKLVPLPEKRPARVNQVQFQGGFSPAETFNLTLVDAAFVRID